MPGFDEVARGEVTALLIVADDVIVLGRTEMTRHEHIGDGDCAQPFDGCAGIGAGKEQNAVHLIAQCGFHGAQFQICVVTGAEDEQRITQTGGDVLQSVGHDAVVRVAHAAHDHADGFRATGAQRRGGAVAHITHFVGDGFDGFARGGGNIAFILQRAGYGVDGIARALCDILQGAAARFKRL